MESSPNVHPGTSAVHEGSSLSRTSLTVTFSKYVYLSTLVSILVFFYFRNIDGILIVLHLKWHHFVLTCVFQVMSIRMQGLVLVIFSKLEHVPFIKDIQTTYTRTGIYHYWVRFRLTSFRAAQDEKIKRATEELGTRHKVHFLIEVMQSNHSCFYNLV